MPTGALCPGLATALQKPTTRNIRAIWNFWIHMRKCLNGVPYYLQHQVWKPDADDERGLGGVDADTRLDRILGDLDQAAHAASGPE